MTGRRWAVVRWTFLVAVIAGAWWSWRASGDELVRALDRVSPWSVVLGGVLVVAGLLVTTVVWLLALRSLGAKSTAREAIPPFFVAQLGKYIPGSVWSFAAQGALGAGQGLPARVPAAAAVLFLGVHVASGLAVVGLLGWWTGLPRLVVTAALVVGVVGLTPAVYRALGRRLAGRRCDWTAGRSVVGALVMVPVWTCYALALTALAPSPAVSVVLALGCSFALAFAVGVAVPIAPAGLGARDGVLILLLAPTLGAGPAGAVAVLGRLLHTVADFLLGGVAWWLLHTSNKQQASGAAHHHH